ncbi:hypothetical protein M9Y10_025907 [Tritrichomonas musculus]|uniref:Uncharacterized protein n=1 Tax=Tritrichomonas musculus TaxID=1915356 RepID=A0ABR2H804_9EUKA
MDDMSNLPHVPDDAPPDDGHLEPFKNMRDFVRHVFGWIMNWDAHYFLPIATTWIGPGSTNWVTRFYMKMPF